VRAEAGHDRLVPGPALPAKVAAKLYSGSGELKWPQISFSGERSQMKVS
jgi:hypothetical protein